MSIPLSLVTIHFIADFLFQSDWMALNKSKRWDALGLHALVYSLCFCLFGWQFVLVTLVTHFVTDAITSRITSRLYANYRHWFFVVIGLDQLIHYWTLAWTYRWLVA